MSQLDFLRAEFITSYGVSSQLPPPERPEFVFSGRSNVGKSSLINKLCNRKKLARVSSTPGKTATINFYQVGKAFLVDLPGYGYAKTSGSERRRWDELISGYFASGRDMRLLLQLLDCRHQPSKDDNGMLDYLSFYQIPFVAVLTKADKLKPSQHQKVLEDFAGYLEDTKCSGVFLVSSEKGTGIAELRQCMNNALTGVE